jgi:hypothetical protein
MPMAIKLTPLRKFTLLLLKLNYRATQGFLSRVNDPSALTRSFWHFSLGGDKQAESPILWVMPSSEICNIPRNLGLNPANQDCQVPVWALPTDSCVCLLRHEVLCKHWQ